MKKVLSIKANLIFFDQKNLVQIDKLNKFQNKLIFYLSSKWQNEMTIPNFNEFCSYNVLIDPDTYDKKF